MNKKSLTAAGPVPACQEKKKGGPGQTQKTRARPMEVNITSRRLNIKRVIDMAYTFEDKDPTP